MTTTAEDFRVSHGKKTAAPPQPYVASTLGVFILLIITRCFSISCNRLCRMNVLSRWPFRAYVSILLATLFVGSSLIPRINAHEFQANKDTQICTALA